MSQTKGALAGVRIVDLTDERGIYGAKLLADLGADVVRPEPPEGDPLRKKGPHREGTPQGCTSLWHAFFASNRRFFSVDLTDAQGRKEIQGIDEVVRNPQLKARDWWVPYRTENVATNGPGAPYHFSDTPWSLGDYAGPGADGELVLAEIGWE